MNNKYQQSLVLLKSRGVKELPQHKLAILSELAEKCPDMTPVDIANEITNASEERFDRAAKAARSKASTSLRKLSDLLAAN